jgi:hypothetical protein
MKFIVVLQEDKGRSIAIDKRKSQPKGWLLNWLAP